MIKFVSLDELGDLFSFYLVETILFILFYIIGTIEHYKYGAPPLLLIMGFIFFIGERKRIFILDKEINQLLVIEKALFQNKFTIIEQHQFSEIQKAYLHTVSCTGGVKYNLGILLKNGNSIYPFTSCNINPSWVKKVESINDFIFQSRETHLEMNDNSFFFRIIGSLILGIHLFSLFYVATN